MEITKSYKIPLSEFYFVCQTHLRNVSPMFKYLITDLFICHITHYEPSIQMIMNQLGDFCFPFSLAKCTQLMTLVCMILLMTLYNDLFYQTAITTFRLGQIWYIVLLYNKSRQSFQLVFNIISLLLSTNKLLK